MGNLQCVKEAIVHRLRGSGTIEVIDYQPGDGTRYELVFADIDVVDAKTVISTRAPAVLVALVNFPGSPSMLLTRGGGFLATGYVQEKMKVTRATAEALVEIIAHVAQREV